MKKLLIALPVLVIVCALLYYAMSPGNRLPDGALHALNVPEVVMLYSLEPGREIGPDGNVVTKDDAFHTYEVLGKIELDEKQSPKAIGVFRDAPGAWDGTPSDCFTPRYALRAVSERHAYDFLLSPECHRMDIYRDDDHLSELKVTADIKALNALLLGANIRLENPVK